MLPVTPSRRAAAQASLVATPLLIVASTVTQPDFGATDDRLAAVADAPLAGISATTFVVAQLPLLIVFLALGLLLVSRAPRLSAWGTALGVLGCFGHAVFGGISLVEVVMSRDESRRAAYTHLVDHLESTPVMLFAAIGMVGTVLGFLLVSIALFRTRTGPVWVGPALWAFLLVEFVGVNVSDVAGYVSGVLLLVAFYGLVSELRAPQVDREPVPV
jgi:hypothetical protein